MDVDEIQFWVGRVQAQAGEGLGDAQRRFAALMAGHAQAGVVVARVDRNAARKRHLGDLMARIGHHVGVTGGAGERVLDMRGRGGLARLQIFGKAVDGMAAGADGGDFLFLVPVVERLAVAIEMPLPEFDGHRLLLGECGTGEGSHQNAGSEGAEKIPAAHHHDDVPPQGPGRLSAAGEVG
jgi:hypothetical protein